MASQLDFQQILQSLYDENSNSLRVGGVVDSIVIAGRIYTQNLDKLKYMSGDTTNTVGQNASNFFTYEDADNAYQVPVGKFFRIVGVRTHNLEWVQSIGSADNEIGTVGDPANLVNPSINPAGITFSFPILPNPSGGLSTNSSDYYAITISDIEAGQYPFYTQFTAGSSGSCAIVGFELDAE